MPSQKARTSEGWVNHMNFEGFFMLFFNVIFLSVLLLFSSVQAMNHDMPPDVIREIVKAVDRADWSGAERVIALKTMGLLNTHWARVLSAHPLLNKPLFLAIAGNPYF